MSNGPALTAYDYFKFGHDTAAIASIMKTTEAEALKQLSRQRSAMLCLPDPYQEPVRNVPRQLVRFAGR